MLAAIGCHIGEIHHIQWIKAGDIVKILLAVVHHIGNTVLTNNTKVRRQ